MKGTAKFAGTGSEAPHGEGVRAVSLHALPGGSRSWQRPPADNDAVAEQFLSRSDFLRMILREKRRTDRSHSALSLAVLDFDEQAPTDRQTLIECVCAMVRETDCVAAFGDRSLAVLLPDTGDIGLQSFCAKVSLSRLSGFRSTAGATYPNAAFDRLVQERLGTLPQRQASGPAEGPQRVAAPGYALKRPLDVIGAVIALVLLSPLMLVVALAVKMSSPGPIIFRQQRIGQGGVPFTFYKFRSMRTGNDDKAHREFVAGLIQGKPAAQADDAKTAQFKIKDDPRVTRVGRFIRKTSIDELPQFWNVLKGDMSLVGPRPPVPYEADNYKSWHRRRVFELKPGLTGIWQVEGRSRVSFDDMVRMDLRYLRECSLGCDIRILLRTVKVVLTCEGAQ